MKPNTPGTVHVPSGSVPGEVIAASAEGIEVRYVTAHGLTICSTFVERDGVWVSRTNEGTRFEVDGT